ncbi:MAG: type II toxin-antitoxin system HicB family antitoxin [Fibromonadaceae bacterium]|jgi:predicted RNase H-like HicB family nuclease|nr:type II toxin-antitoxin system HicB family antitoxin [Fibromonadaceae bacterium]
MKKASFTEKYTYRVEWSAEDNVHIANCLEFPSLFAHGSTVQEALLEMKKVIAETIKWMEEESEEIPEPIGLKTYNGYLRLKMPKTVHKKIAIKSAEEGVSINQYILTRIQ